MTGAELSTLQPAAVVHRPVPGGLCLALRVDAAPAKGEADAPLTATGSHVTHGPGGRLHVATTRESLTADTVSRLHLPRPTCRELPAPTTEEDTDAQR